MPGGGWRLNWPPSAALWPLSAAAAPWSVCCCHQEGCATHPPLSICISNITRHLQKLGEVLQHMIASNLSSPRSHRQVALKDMFHRECDMLKPAQIERKFGATLSGAKAATERESAVDLCGRALAPMCCPWSGGNHSRHMSCPPAADLSSAELWSTVPVPSLPPPSCNGHPCLNMG